MLWPNLCVDSLAQSCGLSLPTLTQQRIGLMLNQLDSAAGNCGVSLPMLFERIGSMAAHGLPPPIGFPPRAYGACGAPSLPGTPATRTTGPEVRPRPPVKTTASSIASGPANGSATAIRMEVAKGFSGPPPKQRTLQTGASSEDRLRRRHRPPLRPDLPKRLHRRGFGNRIRMGIAKPSRGPIDRPTAHRVLPSHRRFWREPSPRFPRHPGARR